MRLLGSSRRARCYSAALLISLLPLPLRAQTGKAPAASLTGVVRSGIEGPMEGVLVSAKEVGSGITTTVVSDRRGRYLFPKERLHPGAYTLAVRAVGYETAEADGRAIQVLPRTATRLDLLLRKTQDIGPQLTSSEWLLSVPGTQEQKEFLFRCVVCHTLEPIVQSRYQPREFLALMNRMRNYAPPSFLLKPVTAPFDVPASPEAERLVNTINKNGKMPRYGYSVSRTPGQPEDAYAAQYLSSVNLSSTGKREYELKTLPRPKGRATRMVITEYDLPRRESQPHDAAVDAEGMVWYTDFSSPYIGRLNPRTVEIREWRMPVLKPGFPEGSNEVEFDSAGNPWVGRVFQGHVAKFDKKKEEFTTYRAPEFDDVRANVAFLDIDPGGKVVFLGSGAVHRMDPRTGEIATAKFSVPKGVSGGFYGWSLDSKGTVYGALQQDAAIAEVDEKSGQLLVYPTPTPNSGPRRVQMDSKDQFWFAEYLTHKLGMLDTTTKKILEWTVPTPWSGTYDVVVDKNGEVWGGGMHSDRIFRFNPRTEQFTEYLVPREMNLRRIEVDNSASAVTLWVGNNHQAKLMKLEPLD